MDDKRTGSDIFERHYDVTMDPISPFFDIRSWFPDEDVDLDSLEFTDAVGNEG